MIPVHRDSQMTDIGNLLELVPEPRRQEAFETRVQRTREQHERIGVADHGSERQRIDDDVVETGSEAILAA